MNYRRDPIDTTWLWLGAGIFVGIPLLFAAALFLFGKLYFVIEIDDRIGGVAGPVPYDMAECEKRAREHWASLNDVTTPDGYSKRDIAFKCVRAFVRPEMDKLAGMPKPRGHK